MNLQVKAEMSAGETLEYMQFPRQLGTVESLLVNGAGRIEQGASIVRFWQLVKIHA